MYIYYLSLTVLLVLCCLKVFLVNVQSVVNKINSGRNKWCLWKLHYEVQLLRAKNGIADKIASLGDFREWGLKMYMILTRAGACTQSNVLLQALHFLSPNRDNKIIVVLSQSQRSQTEAVTFLANHDDSRALYAIPGNFEEQSLTQKLH